MTTVAAVPCGLLMIGVRPAQAQVKEDSWCQLTGLNRPTRDRDRVIRGWSTFRHAHPVMTTSEGISAET